MKKKILEISCNGLTNGGVQQVIMNIVRNLSEDYQFDILVFTKNEDFFDKEFSSYGGRIFRSPHNKKIRGKEIDFYYRGVRILFDTYRILKKCGPYQAIHCHNYFESCFCLLAAKMAGISIRIVHSHNDLSAVPYSGIRKRVQSWYRRGINKFATIRVGCSESACSFLFGTEQEYKVIFNAIDLKRFQNTTVKNYCAISEEMKILHVGNFSPQKNQVFLVEVANELKARGFKFHLIFVGGNTTYQEKVEKKILEFELQEEISIFPQSTNVLEKMAEADVFLFPSEYEGLGIVLIEAQAVGLHCIVSDAVPPEADLGNIEYVHSMEVDVWTDRVCSLTSNQLKRKVVDMSSYDICNVIKEYKEIFEKFEK